MSMTTSNSADDFQHLAHQPYRRDIDGLRAIAVLSVIAFHIRPTLLPGGFTGVDVFFVISGYLMFNLIYYPIQNSRFSFRDFFKRRLRRLMPALFVVSVATAVASCFLLVPSDLMYFAASLAAA